MTIWFATSSGAATFFSGVLHAQAKPKIPLGQPEISAESRGAPDTHVASTWYTTSGFFRDSSAMGVFT